MGAWMSTGKWWRKKWCYLEYTVQYTAHVHRICTVYMNTKPVLNQTKQDRQTQADIEQKRGVYGVLLSMT